MRHAKGRRKGASVATFSAKVDEVMKLLDGMTVANKKKAVEILVSAVKKCVDEFPAALQVLNANISLQEDGQAQVKESTVGESNDGDRSSAPEKNIKEGSVSEVVPPKSRRTSRKQTSGRTRSSRSKRPEAVSSSALNPVSDDLQAIHSDGQEVTESETVEAVHKIQTNQFLDILDSLRETERIHKLESRLTNDVPADLSTSKPVGGEGKRQRGRKRKCPVKPTLGTAPLEILTNASISYSSDEPRMVQSVNSAVPVCSTDEPRVVQSVNSIICSTDEPRMVQSVRSTFCTEDEPRIVQPVNSTICSTDEPRMVQSVGSILCGTDEPRIVQSVSGTSCRTDEPRLVQSVDSTLCGADEPRMVQSVGSTFCGTYEPRVVQSVGSTSCRTDEPRVVQSHQLLLPAQPLSIIHPPIQSQIEAFTIPAAASFPPLQGGSYGNCNQLHIGTGYETNGDDCTCPVGSETEVEDGEQFELDPLPANGDWAEIRRPHQEYQVTFVTNEDVPIDLQSQVPQTPQKTKVHNIVHHCQECGETYTHGRPFKRHLLEHVESDSPLCCRKCKVEFEAYIVYRHHKCRPHMRDIVCNDCGTKFANDKRLQRHVRLKHTPGRVKPEHFCVYCGKGFQRKVSLFKHFKEHAGDMFVCLRCGEFIADKELYYEHIDKHERDAEYMCEKCGIGFGKKQQYKIHLKAHDQFECTECKMMFPSQKALTRHNRLIHAKQYEDLCGKRYKCDMCPKRFPRPGLLELHVRVHTGERPVECDVCKLFFRTPKGLRKHKMTNTHLLKAGEVARERNHLCALCGQAYFRKYALQRHMKTHCDDKPFTCPHCDYKCKESTNLKRHILRHLSERNFICEICGSSFHTKKTLETHVIYKHSNQRDYKCNDCKMSFKTPNALRRHMTSHSDNRPHTCWCGRSFNRMYNLRRHMKSVHGTDEDLPPVRKVRVLEEDVRDVYSTGQLPLTLPVVKPASEVPIFSPHDTSPPTMVNLTPADLASAKQEYVNIAKHDYVNVASSPMMQPIQSPTSLSMAASSLSMPDLKSVHLPDTCINYQIISQQQLMCEEDKAVEASAHLLSEFREVKQTDISPGVNPLTPGNPPSVHTPVPTPPTTSSNHGEENQHTEPHLSSLASVGMETLQDIVHRPINTYDRPIYYSQPTSAPVERKSSYLPNMQQTYVHDFTGFNATSMYGAQFYTDPQRQRLMQIPDGLVHEQLQPVPNGLPADLSKYSQGAE